jgi:hypothetical protein
MKRSVLGGIVSVLLIVTAVLVMYLFVARSTSSFRLQEYGTTVSFMADRIDALEKQRDLLKGSTAALEKEMGILNKRVRQIDIEIQSMKDLVGSAKSSIRHPLFRWDKMRITAGSSLLMIVFLGLIWLLYRVFIKDETSPEKEDEGDSPLPITGADADVDVDAGVDAEPSTGSVLEEEYPLPSEAAGSETEATAEEPPVDDDESTGEAAEAPEVKEPESPSSGEEPDEVKE